MPKTCLLLPLGWDWSGQNLSMSRWQTLARWGREGWQGENGAPQVGRTESCSESNDRRKDADRKAARGGRARAEGPLGARQSKLSKSVTTEWDILPHPLAQFPRPIRPRCQPRTKQTSRVPCFPTMRPVNQRTCRKRSLGGGQTWYVGENFKGHFM